MYFGCLSCFGFGVMFVFMCDMFDWIGGFFVLKDELVDDFWLVELLCCFGWCIVLFEVEVVIDVIELLFGLLWYCEMCWLCMICLLNLVGFVFLFIMFIVLWFVIGVVFVWCFDGSVVGMLVGGVVVVGVFGWFVLYVCGEDGWCVFWCDLLFVVVCDMLFVFEWFVVVFGMYVVWCGVRMMVVGGECVVVVVEVVDGC